MGREGRREEGSREEDMSQVKHKILSQRHARRDSALYESLLLGS